MKVVYFLFFFGILAFVSQCASAEDCQPSASNCNPKIDPVSIWLTTGMRSYHNDREKAYNENNTGYGLEVRIDCEHSFYIGHYENSIHRLTDYIGYAWQPFEYGGLHLGFLTVIATGYTRDNTGAIIAPLPMASYEWKYVGINAVVIPTIVTAVQLKVKLY